MQTEVQDPAKWTDKKIEDRGHKSLGESCKDVGGHPIMLRTCDRSKDMYERTEHSRRELFELTVER
jgi:hypothetical protein